MEEVNRHVGGVDAVGGESLVQRQGVVAQSRTGDADVAHHRDGVDRRRAGGEQQRAVLRGAHAGQPRVDGGHGAEDLRLEDDAGALRGQVGDGHGRGAGDGAVLQHVDRPEIGLDLGKRGRQPWPIGGIGDVRARSHTLPVRNWPDQLVEVVGVTREQRDLEAGGAEALGDREAEAGAGADHGEGLGSSGHGAHWSFVESRRQYSVLNDSVRYIIFMTPNALSRTVGILEERRSSPGLPLALLGDAAMRRLRDAHTAHNLMPRQFQLLGAPR